jgi:transposase-like protein
MGRLSKGETIAEVAADWGVSPRSVYRMAVQARLALGARTNREAMARYARNGYQAEADV